MTCIFRFVVVLCLTGYLIADTRMYKPISTEVGRKVELNCFSPNSYTGGSVNWYRTTRMQSSRCNGNLIKAGESDWACEKLVVKGTVDSNFSSRFSIVSSNGAERTTLIVRNVTCEDSGIYICANSSNNGIYERYNLSVEGDNSCTTQDIGTSSSTSTDIGIPNPDNQGQAANDISRAASEFNSLVTRFVIVGITVVVASILVILIVVLLIRRKSKTDTSFKSRGVNSVIGNEIAVYEEITEVDREGLVLPYESVEMEQNYKNLDTSIYSEVRTEGSHVKIKMADETAPTAFAASNMAYDSIEADEEIANKVTSGNSKDAGNTVVALDGTVYIQMQQQREDIDLSQQDQKPIDNVFQKSVYTEIDHTVTAPPPPPSTMV